MVTADDKYRKILRDNWGYDDLGAFSERLSTVSAPDVTHLV